MITFFVVFGALMVLSLIVKGVNTDNEEEILDEQLDEINIIPPEDYFGL